MGHWALRRNNETCMGNEITAWAKARKKGLPEWRMNLSTNAGMEGYRHGSCVISFMGQGKHMSIDIVPNHGSQLNESYVHIKCSSEQWYLLICKLDAVHRDTIGI